jgi:hypothetical protein
MAAFVGQKRSGLTYQVTRPGDGGLYHVRELDASKTLCGAGCHWLEHGWEVAEHDDHADWHPEDVDADQRCANCYEILDNRHRKARGERPTSSRRRRKMVQTMAAPKDDPVRKLARMRKSRDAMIDKLNADLLVQVRVAQDAGVPMREIADALDVTRQHVYWLLDRDQ